MRDERDTAVVVVSHNHGATLAASLEAVRSLDPAACELVVVDNASSDNSRQIAESSGAQLLALDHNSGFAAAANRGIAATNAPWVLLLNPDCAPAPDFLRHLLDGACLHSKEQLGALSGKLLRSDDDTLRPSRTIDSAGMVVSPDGRHFDRGAGSLDEGQFERPAWAFGGTGAATLYRRRALEDVAYADGQIFPETFFAYREDAELAWRLQLRGWRCLYLPTARAAHRRGFRPEEGRRGHRLVNRLSVRNRFLLRWHCADMYWHLAAFPWWLVRDLLVIGACFSVETSSFGGLLELWSLRKDARKRRQWVQSRRLVSARHIQRWFRRREKVEEIRIQ